MKSNKKQQKRQQERHDDPDLEPLNKKNDEQVIETDEGVIKNRSSQKEEKKSYQSNQSDGSRIQKRQSQDQENWSDDSAEEANQIDDLKHEEKADVWNATINMVKGFVGIGILALPSGFAKSGWLGGLIIFLLCAGMVLYLSLQMMDAANKRKSQARGVTQFSVEVLGQEKELLVNIFLFGIQIGICVAYVIFFTTYFQESLCFFVDYDRTTNVCGSRVPSLLISLIIVTPTIFIRHMSKLKTWSMFSNSLILISMLVVFISCFFKMDTSYITSDKISAIRWGEMGSAIGLFVFAFEGTTLYFEIRSSMQEPTEFKKVLNYSLYIGIALYGCIGLSGYLAFGSGVRDIILFNFPMTNPLYVFIQIFYCIAILLSYPLQMFPLVNILEQKLLERIVNEKNKQKTNSQPQKKSQQGVDQSQHHNQGNQQADDRQDNQESDASEGNALNLLTQYDDEIKNSFYQQSMILRVASLLFIFFFAIVFKRLTVFLNLIGSIGGCFFAFILPVIVYEYSMPEASQKKIYFHRGLLVLGVIFSFFGTLSSLRDIYRSL
ncbi:transmembrane amino acid transporter protein (macronuclear) [Tetrahymena thermophila SB210]|uniref:Transmembrane amino acid transporter protein n=1 Tax=Tetrahymena thermophila (strain SB210) TaxID=312017 RepID=I7LY75_TETTS|nr:transmembrane amino acid transporter protein [Tetrahymena thermophila SB210]EAS07842.1 transmembrane amino acid transporter protein [Tetrahymena thermophila SB210]|eukprot:XP_001028084.1 transmembrane amino acid transporter protein [Tetrahymena thermophila SB210]